ncbi:MAG: hypothetical protein L0I06_05590, partial [Acidipropionibacterium jensenii]|nr:hypothetical protein [Acidipropionibacterium jensenii]
TTHECRKVATSGGTQQEGHNREAHNKRDTWTQRHHDTAAPRHSDGDGDGDGDGEHCQTLSLE